MNFMNKMKLKLQRRLKSIRENKMADVNEFELSLFAPLKYTRHVSLPTDPYFCPKGRINSA
jgi:hypothetical protein